MRSRNNAIMRETCSQRRIIVTLRDEGKKKKNVGCDACKQKYCKMRKEKKKKKKKIGIECVYIFSAYMIAHENNCLTAASIIYMFVT